MLLNDAKEDETQNGRLILERKVNSIKMTYTIDVTAIKKNLGLVRLNNSLRLSSNAIIPYKKPFWSGFIAQCILTFILLLVFY